MDFEIDMQGCRWVKDIMISTTDPQEAERWGCAAMSQQPIEVVTAGGLRFMGHIIELSREPINVTSDRFMMSQRLTARVRPIGPALEPLTAGQRSRVQLTLLGGEHLRQALKDMERSVCAAVDRACYKRSPIAVVIPNCRCAPVPIKKEKPPVKIKKFYVASKPTVENTDDHNWAKDTLPAAIEHAKKLLQQTGEAQYILKVIKVVAKREAPIVVKDVK